LVCPRFFGAAAAVRGVFLSQKSTDAILDSPDVILEMAPVAQLRRLRLSPEEAFVLSRVNRPTPVREVYFCSGLPDASARLIARALLEKGGLVVRREAAPTPVAPARTTPPTTSGV